MYEKAIIDAQQLRETAMKNAQQIVVEKYSNDIKEAVERLLEQNEEESVVDSLPYSHESLVNEESEEEEEGVQVLKKGKKGVAPSKEEEEDEGSSPLMESELEKLLEEALREMQEEDEGYNTLEDQLSEDDSLEFEEDRQCESCGSNKSACECEDVNAEQDDGNFYEETLEEEFEIDEALKFSGSSASESDGWLGSTSTHKDEANELAQVEAIARESQLKAKKASKENKELKSKVGDLEEEINKLTNENRNLSIKMGKLKVALQESSDLSNKLYYTNCVLKDDSLNERQKKTIVESLSKSKDAKEAKTIYETLRNAAGSNQNRKPKSLSEAVNKTTSFVIQPKRTENVSDAGTSVLQERMMRLAGLI